MSITKSIQKFEREFDTRTAQFLWKHPVLGFLSVFIGMPVFVLFCVCISTIIIAFPIVWLFGCL